jgi:hypothetical protein
MVGQKKITLIQIMITQKNYNFFEFFGLFDFFTALAN